MDIHDDGIRIYVDRKLSPADTVKLAQTLIEAAHAADPRLTRGNQ